MNFFLKHTVSKTSLASFSKGLGPGLKFRVVVRGPKTLESEIEEARLLAERLFFSRFFL